MKRAASEVVAAVTLLTVAALVGLTVYAYFANTLSGYASSYSSTSELERRATLEKFVIVSVWVDPATGLVNATVYNSGSTNLVLSAAYINAVKASELIEGFNQPFQPGRLFKAVFNSPVPIEAGTSYELTLASSSGVTVKAVFKA